MIEMQEHPVSNAGARTAALDGLSTVCTEKAEHIATHWQDTTLSKRWMALANRIGLLAPKAKGL